MISNVLLETIISSENFFDFGWNRTGAPVRMPVCSADHSAIQP